MGNDPKLKKKKSLILWSLRHIPGEMRMLMSGLMPSTYFSLEIGSFSSSSLVGFKGCLSSLFSLGNAKGYHKDSSGHPELHPSPGGFCRCPDEIGAQRDECQLSTSTFLTIFSRFHPDVCVQWQIYNFPCNWKKMFQQGRIALFIKPIIV